MDMPRRALEGIRIIDFSHVWQGPVATQILADFGADVIKIEKPGSGDWSRSYGPYLEGLSLPFASLNRNKRSFSLNMGIERGKEVILRLIENADVLVHNFRPGVTQKLGIDYKTLKEINPELIYAKASGWGDEGPYAERKRGGHAKMAAAEAGLFITPGPGDIPIPCSISMDYPAGMLLAQGIMLALIERERSGMGQEVSTDLFSAGLFANIWRSGAVLNPENSKLNAIDHTATEKSIRNAWKTKDGFLEISPVFSQDALKDITLAVGLGDLSLDERFSTSADRLKNSGLITKMLEEKFLEKTTDEWIGILEPKGVLCAKIRSFDEALKDPQVMHNKMIIEMNHKRIGTLKLLGNPIRLSKSPASFRTAPPDLGEHTEEILKELGYLQDDIERLRQEKVIV